jgi:AcrR family transcriptional regulator
MTTVTPTPEPPRARERILDAAVRLMRRQGYAATGIKQIVEEGNAPLGSVYHYFPGGKEQLGVEAVETAGEKIRREIAAAAGARDLPAAVNAYFRHNAERLRDSDWELGCPIANVSQETASSNDRISAACMHVFESWQTTLAGVFVDAGIPARDASELAMFVLASFEGALTMSRSLRDITPMLTTGAAVASVVNSHLGDTPRAG